jgi:hypothetical protein
MESLVKYVGNNQAGSAAIVYGQNYGFVEGAVQALGIRLKFVRPQQWMKALGLGTRGDKSKTVWKNKLKAEAQRLQIKGRGTKTVSGRAGYTCNC